MFTPAEPSRSILAPASRSRAAALLRDTWTRLARPRTAVVALMLPPSALLALTAAAEHDAVPAIAAAGLLAIGAMVGRMAAPLDRATPLARDGTPAVSREAYGPGLAGAGVLAFIAIRIGLQLVGRVAPGEALHDALAAMPVEGVFALMGSAVLSAMLLLAPPVSAKEHGRSALKGPPLARERTLVAVVAIASIGALCMRLRAERWAPGEGATLAAELPALERRYAAHPTHHATQYRLGNAYERLERNAEAARVLERAVATDAHDGWAHNDLGFALVRQRRDDEAIPHFRDAIPLLVDDSRPRYNLASALWRRGDFTGAEREYRAIAEHFPDDAAAAAYAGWVRFENGDRDRGEAEVRHAHARAPDSAVTNLAMANVLTTRAKLAEAIPYFKAYLARVPKDLDVLSQYAFVLVLDKHDAEAARVLDGIETLAPGYVDYTNQLRFVRARLGRPQPPGPR